MDGYQGYDLGISFGKPKKMFKVRLKNLKVWERGIGQLASSWTTIYNIRKKTLYLKGADNNWAEEKRVSPTIGKRCTRATYFMEGDY